MQTADSPYNYDGIYPGYYDKVFCRNSGIQSKWHHLKFDCVRHQLSDDTRNLLDIGCGPGTFIGTLPEAWSCLGVDLAARQIQYAIGKYSTPNHHFVSVQDAVLPCDDELMDAVTLIEVIEHLSLHTVKALLAEAMRVLRPGGRLIITTPNYGSLWPLLEKFVNANAPVTYEDQHVLFFTKSRLSQLLLEVGFREIRVTTFMGVAAFLAPAGWNIASKLHSLETRLLTNGLGFLLLGTATKGNQSTCLTGRVANDAQ